MSLKEISYLNLPGSYNIEYLLRLGKAEHRINTIDNPINQIRIINGR